MSLGFKAAVVYTLSTVFTRGLAIFTTPIFTRLMTTQDIGTVNLFNMWYSLIGSISTLSLTSGGFAVAMKEYPGRRDQYESSVLTLTSLMAVVFAVIYWVAPGFWNGLFGLQTTLMILILIGCLVAPARDFWLARQRYEYKYKLSAVVSIGTALVASVVSVVTVVYLNNKGSEQIAQGRLLTNYFVIFGVAAIIWVQLLRKGKTFFNKEFWKMSLSLSVPLIGYQIAAQILSMSDRLMISRMVNNSAVGIYSTLYTVSSLSLLVWGAINASFVPYLFRNIAKENNKIKEISTTLLGVYAIVAVILTYLAPEIVKVLATEEYYQSIYIMPPIAAGIFFTSVSNIYSNIAVYYKKTNYVMYPTIVAAVLNIVLNYIFILRYGYMAAAYTTMTSYMLMGFLQAKFANKLYNENVEGKTPYDDKAIIILSMVTVIGALTALPLYHYGVLRYVIVVALIFCVLIVLSKWEKIKNQ